MAGVVDELWAICRQYIEDPRQIQGRREKAPPLVNDLLPVSTPSCLAYTTRGCRVQGDIICRERRDRGGCPRLPTRCRMSKECGRHLLGVAGRPVAWVTSSERRHLRCRFCLVGKVETWSSSSSGCDEVVGSRREKAGGDERVMKSQSLGARPPAFLIDQMDGSIASVVYG